MPSAVKRQRYFCLLESLALIPHRLSKDWAKQSSYDLLGTREEKEIVTVDVFSVTWAGLMVLVTSCAFAGGGEDKNEKTVNMMASNFNTSGMVIFSVAPRRGGRKWGAIGESFPPEEDQPLADNR